VVVYLEGEWCYLAPLDATPQHVSKMQEWVNDGEVTQYLFTGIRPVVESSVKEMLEKGHTDDIGFAIYAGDGEFIGVCGLYSILFEARSAEYRIFIGDKTYWGQGIGSEVTRLVLDYAFNRLNLNMVWLGVNADHKAAIACYEHAGFTQEGRLRDVIYRNGRYHDALRYSILRSEFDAL